MFIKCQILSTNFIGKLGGETEPQPYMVSVSALPFLSGIPSCNVCASQFIPYPLFQPSISPFHIFKICSENAVSNYTLPLLLSFPTAKCTIQNAFIELGFSFFPGLALARKFGSLADKITVC